jgi:hypothetical protein
MRTERRIIISLEEVKEILERKFNLSIPYLEFDVKNRKFTGEIE